MRGPGRQGGPVRDCSGRVDPAQGAILEADGNAAARLAERRAWVAQAQAPQRLALTVDAVHVTGQRRRADALPEPDQPMVRLKPKQS